MMNSQYLMQTSNLSIFYRTSMQETKGGTLILLTHSKHKTILHCPLTNLGTGLILGMYTILLFMCVQSETKTLSGSIVTSVGP